MRALHSAVVDEDAGQRDAHVVSFLTSRSRDSTMRSRGACRADETRTAPSAHDQLSEFRCHR